MVVQYCHSPICLPFNNSLNWLWFTDAFTTPMCNRNGVNDLIVMYKCKDISCHTAVSGLLNQIRDHLRKLFVNKPIGLGGMCLWVPWEMLYATARPIWIITVRSRTLGEIPNGYKRQMWHPSSKGKKENLAIQFI